jgi:hypothetical protein
MKVLFQIGAPALQAARKLGRTLRQLAGEGRPNAVREHPAPSSLNDGRSTSFYGFRPMATRGTSVTNEFVNQLRDDSGV